MGVRDKWKNLQTGEPSGRYMLHVDVKTTTTYYQINAE
jgi:hypothetical protein